LLNALWIIGKDILRQVASRFITDRGIDEFEKKLLPKIGRLSEIDKDTVYFDGLRRIEDEMRKIRQKYPKSKVVVFIDDLDRCSENTALQVFESIKVFLGIEGFVYVVGLSHEKLANLITAANEKSGASGEEYLRKIIQLEFTVPQWNSSDIEELTRNLSKKLGSSYENIVMNNLDLISKGVEPNPREIKRFINEFILSFDMYSTTNIVYKPREFLLVKLIQSRWHDIYIYMDDYEFRDLIKKLAEYDSDTRLEYYQQQKGINIEYKKILDKLISNSDLWNFFYLVKGDILKIDSWIKYRRVIESVKYVNTQQIETIETKPIEELLKEGLEHYDTRRYDAAIRYLDQVIRKDVKNKTAWHYKGLSLGGLKNYEEAIKCYDRVLELDPKDHYALYNKAYVFYLLKDYDSSIEHIDKCLKVSPDYTNAWNLKGLCYEKQQKPQEAIKFYETAIKIAPTNFYPWLNKGYALDSLKRYEEAIKCYDKVNELNPGYVEAWNYKGTDLYDLGRHNEALVAYDKVLELDPNYPNIWYNKGLAYEALGDISNSQASFERNRERKRKD
jgi:tetratricopeptide (TPR) repeat protein